MGDVVVVEVGGCKDSKVDGGGSGGACGVLGDERQARANGSADGNAAGFLKSTGRLWLFVASESLSPRFEGKESAHTHPQSSGWPQNPPLVFFCK